MAQPTRAELFRLLTELKRPATTEELATSLSLHPNGVRIHLERLAQTGFVVRERARQSRGRPRDTWAVAADARPGGQQPRGYADLARWLAHLIPSSTRSMKAVEATGREIGRGLVKANGPAEETMRATLSSLGFRPSSKRGRDGKLTYRLGNCPYRDAVRENQPAICTLHRGLTRGLLDSLSAGTELVGFVARDPRSAGCLIELRGGLADEPLPDTQETAER